jgi:uncharacterized membrane protein
LASKAVIGAAAVWLATTSSERRERLTNFVDPFKDYHDAGWQPAHGLFALSSGGWFGEGIGASQQKWGDLPEAHTDFIFAVIGEELGLVGTLLVVGLFLVIAYAAITNTILMTLYSLNNMPYAALGGVMTGDVNERTSLNSYRFVAVNIAQFIVGGFTLPLVAKFAVGHDRAYGWQMTMTIWAVLCLVLFIITFATSRERIKPVVEQASSPKQDFADLAARRRAGYVDLSSDQNLADLMFAELRRRRVLG